MSSFILNLIFHVLLLIICIRQIIFSIGDVLIGRGIIQDQKYDTPVKRKLILIHGIFGIVVSIIGSIFFITTTVLLIL
jgi:hypothetical protein